MLEAYGVWQEKNLYGNKSMGIARTTYIVDPAGKIQKLFPKVKVEGHAKEVMAALKS
jgi:peroxiredoxin Q/BCP